MHQTKKGNERYFGMKVHVGVDAGTGYTHTVVHKRGIDCRINRRPGKMRKDRNNMSEARGSRRPDS